MSLEKKHGITFHKDMFMIPNKKGYEIVTYFLFSKLTSATGKDYNIPWPLVCKEHDRVFQKTCYSHLQNFSQENCIKFPRIVPSLLSTFGGDRFYEIYLAFSSYVLYKTIKKDGEARLLSIPSVSQENFTTAKEILQLSTTLNTRKFRNTEILSYSSHKILLQFAKNLEESLRQLKLLLKSCDELIKTKKDIILSLHPAISEGGFSLSNIIDKSFENLKPVLKQRKILDKFLSSEQTYWQHLCSEVGEKAENEFLNGQDFEIQLTDYIPDEYVKELKNAGYLSSNENGKLSAERFIKIFEAYLSYIVALLRKVDLDELQKNCFVEDASSIEDDLKCIKNLNKKLSDETIPNIEENIEKLKTLNGYDDSEEDSELSSDLFCPLPNLSYDIEAVKQRTSHFNPSLEKIVSASLEKQPRYKMDDSVFSSEKSPLEHGFSSPTDQNFPSSNSSSVFNILPEGVAETTKLVESNLNAHSEVSVSNPPSNSNIDISSLDDLDFSFPTQFKMRESWLKEDSLDTMTLPDMSFDE